MGHAPCCKKVGLKKGRWTVEEDRIPVEYIKAHDDVYEGSSNPSPRMPLPPEACYAADEGVAEPGATVEGKVTETFPDSAPYQRSGGKFL